ncbi:molybdopterin-dependent oxidoreductase [Tersicoccus sp. MR15.9]|uniref:molybdopterin-dependent oxidoreductase n=1 Tax=Tersicoccus mangrovi TaxID=3121635 RepID=UPI002FE6A5F9
MERAVRSPVRHPRLTVVLGRWLGAAFLTCFATGVFSHVLQDASATTALSSAGLLPTRPVSLYRITQGVHVTAGIAAIPLLLGKLWSVYPRLLEWPPVRSMPHALERASIALFVSASLVQVTIGLINTYQWYPWPFPFRQTHYWLAWVIIGSLVLHVAIKLPVILDHWRRPLRPHGRGAADPRVGVSRRGVLAAIGLGSAALVTTTAGQSLPALAGVNVLAPRRMGVGPQGVPVNRTSAQAAVGELARDPGWALTVTHDGRSRSFTLEALRALPQREHDLPIACVEGWSQNAHWRGVPVRELLTLVGAPAASTLRFTSLEPQGSYREMTMPAACAADEQTLVALELNGAVLDLEHGYPARVIAPGRPGVLQTKWLSSVEVIV